MSAPLAEYSGDSQATSGQDPEDVACEGPDDCPEVTGDVPDELDGLGLGELALDELELGAVLGVGDGVDDDVAGELGAV
jgi:hypothetical protein